MTTKIVMSLLTPMVNTRDLIHTLPTLKSYLPSVLYSTCLNDERLPFEVEVQETEIGHLFEHILLEYLCYFKLLSGGVCADYSGVTRWNWNKDPWGVFMITVGIGQGEEKIFTQAMQQSILLTELLLTQQDVVHNECGLIQGSSIEAFLHPFETIQPIFPTAESNRTS